jgi:putative spermidine/putrescine transport system ATP-binding protein
MSFLVARDLRKTYGPVTALADIGLEVEEGEFVTLLGPSGSGKTTLLMAIAGFTRPDSGTISLAGRDITGVEPEDRDFGFVFQGYALFPHMSVADNIAFPLKVRKWDRARIAARVEEMLATVGLGEFAKRKPRELSGGQQQRVAIARALAFHPKILLLDEPLSALDRTLRETMQRELKRLHRQTGVTFLYVTHDQEEAIAMSDRIAVFQKGRIVQVGAPRDLYYAPSTRFVAGFLGVNNLVDARLVRGAGGAVEIEALGARVALPPGKVAALPEGPATVFMRPEDIALEATPGEPSLAIAGTVADVSFVGSFDLVVIQPAVGPEITAHLAADRTRALAVGTPITVHVRADAIGVVPNT